MVIDAFAPKDFIELAHNVSMLTNATYQSQGSPDKDTSCVGTNLKDSQFLPDKNILRESFQILPLCKNPGYSCCQICRHATCYNNIGSFTCQCNTGFFDIEGNGNCLDVDECLSGVAICPRQTECKNTIGSYDCPCIAGHELKTDEISDQEGASGWTSD